MALSRTKSTRIASGLRLLVAQTSDETFELITHGGFPPTDYGKPKVSVMKSQGRQQLGIG